MAQLSESQMSLNQVMTLEEEAFPLEEKTSTLTRQEIHNQLKNVAWPKYKVCHTHGIYLDRCKKLADMYMRHGIPDHDLALNLSKDVMQSPLQDAYMANLDTSRMLTLEIVLTAIRDCDEGTKNLNPYEQFKLVAPGPNENFEHFIKRTEISLKELQVVSSDKPELATRMIKEQFIEGAKIPPWIAQHLEPIDDLNKVASVAQSLMKKNAVRDRGFRHPQPKLHAWTPIPSPSLQVQPQCDYAITANLAPQNFHQPIRLHTGTEPGEMSHFHPENQQPHYGDGSGNQLNPNPHTQKRFRGQTLSNGQQEIEEEPKDPKAPLFGPYNRAWFRANKPA